MSVIYGLAKDFVFKDAVNFLMGKKSLPLEEYKMLDYEARVKSFTVSGYISIEILQTFQNSLIAAIEEGQTKESFRKNMNTFLVDEGYAGISPFKSDTIFRTNMQTAFNAGHYKSMTDNTVLQMRPYWKYVSAGDNHVRELHAAMNGKVYPATDPIWDIWYPPNGFRCRCTVVSLSKHQVERQGIKVETQAPYQIDYSTGEVLSLFPDKGFSTNPAKVTWKPDMKNISPVLKKVFNKK